MQESDLQALQRAMAASTLGEGLRAIGDRWSPAILLGAFTGLHRFDEWQQRLGIPRRTLALRLRRMVDMGLMTRRAYQQRPLREGYHLMPAGLALYPMVLMAWAWERRWGTRPFALPRVLTHSACGQPFVPLLHCGHCHTKVRLQDLQIHLRRVTRRRAAAAGEGLRSGRVGGADEQAMAIGLRVDRWALLIVAAVILGCHQFEQLARALSIARSVLSRRLRDMVAAGLLLPQPDLHDARRLFYRLTPASRDLFGYIVCLSRWSSEHLCGRPDTIAPRHGRDGHAFVPAVVCSACEREPLPHDVSYRASAPGG